MVLSLPTVYYATMFYTETQPLFVRLQVRPVYVYNADRVRAHLFLCMLAYYVEWHLRRRLAPLLFEDDDRQQARAKAKADTKTTAEGFPVLSLKTLLADLATLTLNQVTLPTK